ncbi:MAG TPA: glycerophosphodiester phosphodiesterase [Marmoricola sp.]|nr:glycerophosphodiester phosphodiesterase [Marmoricola sp.]
MGAPRTGFAYLDDPTADGGVVAMAHRGGAGSEDLVGLENTAHAFRHAVALGFTYLETDVHLNRSGDLIAFHDEVLDRVTNLTGRIADADTEMIRTARIGGQYPVPWLSELLEEFPDARFNIDLKGPGTDTALADLLDRTGAHDRVCVGSFSLPRIRAFRRRTAGRVATSAAPVEVGLYLAAPTGGLARILTGAKVPVLQVPHRRGSVPVVTRSLIRRAHAAGAHVHVWTINDPAEMADLLDLGVDGLITDRIDVLKDLLIARGLWSPVL